MKKFTILLFLAGLAVNAQPFEIEWSKTFGGSERDRGHRIFETADGGYMAYGITRSEDGDVSSNPYGYAPWFIKLDNNGNMLWEKTISPISGEPMQSFNTHEVPEVGYLVPTLYFDQAGNRYRTNLVMVDYDINILWIQNLDHLFSLFEDVLDIMPVSDGGYLGLSRERVTKLYPNFEVEWIYDTPHIYKTSYELSDGSFILLRGIRPNEGDFKSIIKLSASGESIWEYSHPTETWFFDVITTSDNNLILVGLVDLFPFDEEEFDIEYFIMKMTPEGEVLWTKNYGGSWSEWARHVYERNDGGFMVLGWTQSFDGDVSESFGFYDSWVIALDEDGNLQCERSFGGSDMEDSNNVLWKSQIRPTDNGFIFITNSKSSDYDVPENKGDYDYWIVKVAMDLEECNTMSVVDTNHIEEISIFPNPAKESMHIRSAGDEIQKVELYDLTGRKISEKNQISSKDFQFDLGSSVQSGNYILKVYTLKGAKSFKIIKK